ncbi:EAL domain-containing protein [Oceanisphaera pacifica]|uniref:EAL domain-containing protein n=1 Tax=Oceanisphaera pacifica TaxID=2818389 RepID=A0ABS3NDE9_9GAMM|nr:EAL domain-containing protein [Oceanisphaera pacifica]MBO1518311.1 EAL domain-containing protein [Oceanisphaera pacifica]
MTPARQVLADLQHIQNQIAHHAPLDDILSAIIDMVAAQLSDASVSFMLLSPEDNTLSVVASHGLSDTYCQAAQQVPVGPNIASCGASAYRKKIVITPDIEADINWHTFLPLTRAEGLVSCWSAPVLSVDDTTLGTFATYYRDIREPTQLETTQLMQAANLVALAIARQQDRQAVQRQEQRFSSLFTQQHDAVFEMDLTGHFLNTNPAVTRLIGFSPEQLVGVHFEKFVVKKDYARTQEAFEQACLGRPQYFDIDVYNVQQHILRLHITNLPIIVDNKIVGVYGIARDVSAQYQQEAELRLLQRGIDASRNGVVMADASVPELPVVYVNAAFEEITGYSKAEAVGVNCRFLQGEGTDPDAVAQVRLAITERREQQVTLLNYRKDGTPFWNLFSLAPVFDEQGECTHFVGIQQDVTRQQENEEKLRFQRTHDQLTGLLNRPSFEFHLNHLYHHSPDAQQIRVLVMNLDGFKSINEGLEHYVGDCLLQAVAERLTSWLQPEDYIARLGGDDFGILLFKADEDAVAQAAENLLTLLSRPFVVNEHVLHISASLGISSFDSKLHDSSELIQRAHVALHEAKLQGRNIWQCYTGQISAPTLEHISLRREMFEAIEEQQFVVYYQPLVDARTGEVRSLEALIRWHHPERGMVPPNDFIPLAEHTGQIISIDQWVLRQACLDTVAMNASRPHAQSVAVAVNISPIHFRRAGFVNEVQQVLAESGLAPYLLELEVTEGVLMSGADTVIKQLDALRHYGVRVAIDDFGTGFSSLSYLRQLPINKVKLDRCFIEGIDHQRDSAAIVQGVITMAHNLGLQVVAEGVEAHAEWEDLTRRGCDFLQGYLFSRPVPLIDVMALPNRLPV